MSVWHCKDCHQVGFYFNDEQRDLAINKHAVLGHDITELERIHPLDLAELLNAPVNDVVDVFKYEANGETVIEFPKTGKRYIQDETAPRRGSDVS